MSLERSPSHGLEATEPKELPVWMRELERAHEQLRLASRLVEGASPTIDLRPGARHIEAAFAAIYDAFDGRDDRFGAADRSLVELRAAVDTWRGGVAQNPALGFAQESVREATAALESACRHIAPISVRPQPPPPDLRASREMPALHVVPRASLRPTLRVREPAPKETANAPAALAELSPRTFEELETAVAMLRDRAEARRRAREDERAAKRDEAARAALASKDLDEPPPGFSRGPLVRMAPIAFVAARARECFEEIALVGMQRAPLLGEAWRSTRFLELRMLHALDAVAAMGQGALAQLEPWVRDAPAKEPARLFALTMAMGCVDGRDAIAAAERIYLASSADADLAAAFGGALKLVPHPLVPLVARTLLASADPSHRALAIDVLAYRSLAAPRELATASGDASDTVSAAALPWFALTHRPDVLATLDDAAARYSPGARGGLWLAMAISGDPRCVRAAMAAIESGDLSDDAPMIVAIAGDGRDAERLVSLARDAPSRPLVNALGWTGHVDAVELLLALLAHDDAALKLTAAYALDRITGARLYETSEIEPEDILVDDVPEPEMDIDGAPPPPRLAAMISDPRDLPGKGASDALEQPIARPAPWRAWWSEKRDTYDRAARYRRGHPYTPLVSLLEVDTLPLTPGERRWLLRELAVRTGAHVPMDPHDFIPVQEAALRAWRPFAERASTRPGAWTIPFRRRA